MKVESQQNEPNDDLSPAQLMAAIEHLERRINALVEANAMASEVNKQLLQVLSEHELKIDALTELVQGKQE